ncbi:MAG TPA: FxsA family protein [Methylophilaceae bacterium]|nr:FxsA family protein [Methylophilaceae bacterium]
MRLLFIFAILLAFPATELWILAQLGDEYGWWVFVYVLLMIALGWRLIQDERHMVFGRVAQALASGGTPVRAIFGSAKNLLAGVLLILPGVISDLLAVILLLLPGAGRTAKPGRGKRDGSQAANDDIIEGEFRRED